MKALSNLIFFTCFVIASLWYCGFMDGETLPMRGVHHEEHTSDEAAFNALLDSPTRAEAERAKTVLYLFADDGKPVRLKFGHWKKGV